MKHGGLQLAIATGHSAKTKVWKNKKITWSELVDKLKAPTVTNETYKEFISANKDDQSRIKDVGGFVGGYLRNGRRNPTSVVFRQLVTLDVDFATPYFWDNFTMFFACAAILHGTHKHSNDNPRLRLIIPLAREVSADEYPAVARYIAGMLNIELFDNTTFQSERLMFWPSVSSDAAYYFEEQEGDFFNPDEALGSYIDWRDSSLWPTADKKDREIKEAAKKQEDPTAKKGIIGAFCRCYPISAVIEKHLSDVYSSTDSEERYTYKNGSTSCGLVVYDDLFAFSHHGTDPISGKLCNAFDLVRVHKFGHLDTDNSSNKSQKAMEELAAKDLEVKKLIARENLESARYDFAGDENTEPIEQSLDWMKGLEVDGKGNYLSSANNISLILANDVRLKSNFGYNQFDRKMYVFRSLPWRKIQTPEPIRNVDFAGVRNYIESIYGIAASQKIDDALTLEFEKNAFHPIQTYLKGLAWDGEKRIDKLLIDYLGTEDNIYTREAIRKALVGAVARVFNPGCKFDLVLTLIGEQGKGKSTFIRKLGGAWFSDSFHTLQGKEAFEQIQGAWLIEMAELSGLKKAEVEGVKHFISKQADTYRPAFGKTVETYPRQCIFFATTNQKDFLRDPSGNRRFMPIDIDLDKASKEVLFSDELETEAPQIWAEAVELYKAGEALYLSEDAEKIARKEQRQHSEVDERRGVIENYLDTKLPKDWTKMDAYERRNWMLDPLSPKRGEVERQFVCVAEIWCECLGKNKEDMSRYNTRDVNEILRSLEGWRASKSTKNFEHYGKQKYYYRA